MIISGITKLRLSVAFLFFCYVALFTAGFFSGMESSENFDDWWDSLSYSEQDELVDLMENYETETAYDDFILIIDLVLGGGLFVLLLKVYKVNNISSNYKTNVDMVTLKRDIVGTEPFYATCDRCGTEFYFDKNVNEPTYVRCPKCGKQEII